MQMLDESGHRDVIAYRITVNSPRPATGAAERQDGEPGRVKIA